jgi:hypothetical protein
MARVKATLLRRRFAALTRAMRSRTIGIYRSVGGNRVVRLVRAGSGTRIRGRMAFYAMRNHVVILHGRMTTSWHLPVQTCGLPSGPERTGMLYTVRLFA